MHSTEYFTGKRGLGGNDICITSSCCVSCSNSLVDGRPTSSLLIQSHPAARRFCLVVYILLSRAILNSVGHVCTSEVARVQTNDCIVAARAIPAATAPSFPSVTFIAKGLSLAHNRSGCHGPDLCAMRRRGTTGCFSLSDLFSTD